MHRLAMPVEIETERLFLQRLKYEDAEEIFYAYASKPRATHYLSWATHESVDDTRLFLQYSVANWNFGTDYSYSIRLKSGLLIGSIGIVNDEGKVQIGYVLSPGHWGQGYTTEACSSVLSVLKTLDNIHRDGTFVDAENFASIKVLEKCGLVKEADLVMWFRFVNQGNQPRDCILFRFLP